MEAPRLQINIFVKSSAKENVGFREGAQRGISGSAALEALWLQINTFVQHIDKETVGFRE